MIFDVESMLSRELKAAWYFSSGLRFVSAFYVSQSWAKTSGYLNSTECQKRKFR